MKHSSRKLLSLLLVLSLCLGMMPMSVFAETETEAINEQFEAEEFELSQSGAEESADLEGESEDFVVFETGDEEAPEAVKKADVTVLEEKKVEEVKVDLEKKVDEDNPIEMTKKAEMPAEALVKAAPVEEDGSMVKIVSDAAMNALTTEADTKSENARTIYVVFYIDYTGPYNNVYQSNNFPEGTKTLASIAPDVSDKKDGYVFMYWCQANYTGKDPIEMDVPLVIKSDLDDTIHAGAVWGHIVEYVIDGEKIDYDYDDGRSHITRDDGVHIVKDGSYTSQPNVKREGYVSEWPEMVPVTTDRTIANENPVEGHWVKVWTVSFVDENGEDIDKPQTVKEGKFAEEPKKDPVKDGFIFDGWYLTVENGESVNYFEADEDTKAVKSDITLVAHWTEKTKYTVSFYDENGTKIEDADQTVYEGGFAVPYDYESEEYEGQKLVWNIKDAEGILSEYDFNTPVTGNIELYAVWEDVFTVVYRVTDPNSSLGLGTAFTRSYQCSDAGSIELPTIDDIRKEAPDYSDPAGFVFVGWASSPDGAVLKANADGTYDLAALLEASNAAANDDAAQSSGQPATKPGISASDNPGQESNWEVRPDWPGTIIPGGDIIPITPISGDLRLYSVWEEVFTINYHTNYPTDREGGKPEDNKVSIDPYAGLAEDAVKPEQFVLKSLDDAKLKFETPEGYEFEGWYIVYNAGATSSDPQVVTPTRPPWADIERPIGQMEDRISVEARDISGNQGKEKVAEDEASQGGQSGQLDTGDTPAAQSGTSDRLYQPEESYNIYRTVDVYAIWLEMPVVMYNTYYAQFSGTVDLGGLVDAEYQDPTPYSAKDILTKQIDVLTFDETGFTEPNGYTFDHWLVKYDDRDPRAESPVMPEFDEAVDDSPIGDDEHNEYNVNKDAEKNSDMALVEARVPEAAMDKKESLVQKAVKASIADEAANSALNTATEKEPLASKEITKYPGDKQELHFRVDFYAIYVPAYWVQYNSNYPSELNLDVQLANDNIAKDKEDVIYNVLSLEDVTKKNPEFKAPVGYKFLGWSLDDPAQTEKLMNAPDDTITFPGAGNADVKPSNGNTVIDKEPGVLNPIDLSQLPDKYDGQTAPSSGLVSAGGNSEVTKAAADEKATDEKDPGTVINDMPPEQDYALGTQDETSDRSPEHVFYAQWEKVYGVYWVDEDGSTDDPLATGTYDTFDPDTFDPAAEYGKQDGPDTDTLTKTENGVTYVFDHWELKEFNENDQTAVYEAVYKPVENQTTPPTGGTTPNRPTTNEPTEEPTEISDPDTPLAPATVEEEDAEEVGDDETPLAGFEVDPEEDEEVAEEALPFSPFTGDERNTAVWLMISILSLLGIVLVARRRREE